MALDSRALNTEAGSIPRNRGERYPPAVVDRRRRNPRRRLVVPVSNVEGAEMQLPALPAVRYGRRIMTLLFIAGFLLLGFYLAVDARFMVSMPVISGGHVLSDIQVSSIAGVRGKSIFFIDPAVVRERLESYPEIASAEVSLKWPARVEIHIQERVPVVSWMDGGRLWWISADGIAFLSQESDLSLPHLISSGAVLQITDDPLEPVVDPAIVQTVQNLTIVMPEVQEFTFDPEHGLGFIDPHGWQAFFGKGGNLGQKMVVYQAVVSELIADEVVPELVSVEQITAPYYR